MRVLVTGGTGFVGFHSVRALRAAEHEPRLLARSAAKVERLFPGAGPGELVIGDVTDPTAVAKALDGVEAVVHCAAVVAIEARRAHEVRETNLRSVELVVGGAADRGIRAIVYVSSLTALFAPGAPISEDSPIGVPHSPYARSKADGEAYVRRLQEAGAPVRTVYPPAVIGPDDPGLSEANHAVRAFLTQLMVDTATGFEVVDVRDLAALIAALVAPGAAPGRYVVSGRYRPWADTIALIDELTGRRVRRVRINGESPARARPRRRRGEARLSVRLPALPRGDAVHDTVARRGALACDRRARHPLPRRPRDLRRHDSVAVPRGAPHPGRGGEARGLSCRADDCAT
jgi:nucleoside-diphosphate-sugar epimerase